MAAAAGAVAGLVTRWRRGGPRVRQQLLLLALAACPPALVLLAVIIANGVPGWVFGVVLLPVPIAIAIAILSHGLYDLRHAAHRTLLWLAMSGTVVGIYALVVTAAVALIPDHHGWWPSAPRRPSRRCCSSRCAKRCSAPLTASSTAAGTSLMRYWPAWASGWRPQPTSTACWTPLSPSSPPAWTCARSASGILDGAAVAGDGTRPGISIALQAYGATVGWLTYRPPDRQLSAAEQRLVRDLARQLGGALHARLLRDDLQRARERLVLAREEERRRLRRDLHDGIGPALAGLTLKTETARALLPPGTDGASQQLQGLSEEIRRTVLDVRRLVEGLRPPALDELGLAGACSQAVERLTAGGACRQRARQR